MEKSVIEESVEKVVKALSEKCSKDDLKSEDALRFSQAALNLAHTLEVIALVKKA